MKIELENLDKAYDASLSGKSAKDPSQNLIHAVNNVSLTIPSNKIFGIIGKSGAGKSTLVRLISLLEKPDSGTVLYNGKRVDTLTGKNLIARRRKIGMIFQNFNLFLSRNAEQNIAYPLEIAGIKRAEIKKRCNELLSLVSLSDKAKSPVSKLSGGQKQRVAIARALANNPDILFCDEATSALDPQTTQSILNLIREIQNKMNLTVVMITHQMEVVRDACEFVAVIDEGNVVEQGTVEDIFIHPESDVTKEFLSRLAPAAAQQQNSSQKFVRWSDSGGKYILRFKGENTDLPILSKIAKKFDISYNVRAGGIQSVHGTRVGTMLIDFIGKDDEINKTLKYLQSVGVESEAKK